ncbi:MAG: glycosyltransferase [Oscillospiraceae bacterium]
MIATDTRIYNVSGQYYADNAFVPILERYCAGFNNLALCARIYKISSPPEFCREITGLAVSYVGFNRLLDALSYKGRKEIRKAVRSCDLVIARVPSVIAYQAANAARSQKKPYLAEAMACAWDGYLNHSLIGKLAAPYMFLKMRCVVYNADFATYVTESFLQKRYPCKNRSTGVSNVKIEEMEEDALKKRMEKIGRMERDNINLMTAGGVNVRAKGQQYVIRAIKRLAAEGINVTYCLAGKGDQSYLRKLASRQGVSDNVVFLGGVSRGRVFELLDLTDIYIQPSKQEGLPRAVIEAMSRGCPVLGANTGGIPELLQKECIFKRGSVNSVVAAVKSMLRSDMAKYASENFENAKKYRESILNEKRTGYYAYVSDKCRERAEAREV